MTDRRVSRPFTTDLRTGKAVLAFSGYNPRGLVAFWRTLAVRGVALHIVAAGPGDFVFKTAFKDRVVSTRRCADLLWSDLERVLDEARLASPHDDLVLCPSSEYLNHFALENRDRFSERGIQVPLVPKEVYDLVTNKESFASFCRLHGLRTPERVERLDPGSIPFVAKPRKNIAGGRTLYPYLVTSPRTYQEFIRSESVDDYYLEEYVAEPGSYYLLYYVSKTGDAVSFSQRNLLQQGGGKSMVLCEPARLHEGQLSSTIVRMLTGAGFFGLVMVEVRRHRDGHVVLEANPRLWGPSQLHVDNHTGIFDAFLADHLGLPRQESPPPAPARSVPYMWTGGLVDARRRRSGLMWHVRGGAKRALALARALFRDVYLRRDTIRYYLAEMKPVGR